MVVDSAVIPDPLLAPRGISRRPRGHEIGHVLGMHLILDHEYLGHRRALSPILAEGYLAARSLGSRSGRIEPIACQAALNHLDPPPAFIEGPLQQVGVADALAVLDREMEVCGQRAQVRGQAIDRSRVAVAVLLPVAGLGRAGSGDRRLARYRHLGIGHPSVAGSPPPVAGPPEPRATG